VNDKSLGRVIKHLCGVLKRRRKELGMTQEDVADALGMVARQYQKIEAGETNLTLRTLVRLGLALRIDLREFF
jgi:transcriptional regulator with XRE-family HTH domain